MGLPHLQFLPFLCYHLLFRLLQLFGFLTVKTKQDVSLQMFGPSPEAGSYLIKRLF